MEYLYEKLTAYGNSDYYAFHMPGHKRNMELMRARLPYNIDITEIDGFDDLHHAEGFVRKNYRRMQPEYFMRKRRIIWLMGVQSDF